MGRFSITDGDQLPLQNGCVILVGPDEPGFWAVFTASAEYSDGAPDPLDGWSKRILDQIASTFGGYAIYPFEGPPFQPFQTWAVRTGRAWASPIGFLVHDTAGLFASYRGALVLPWTVENAPGKNPCETCTTKPCQTTCPVDAFADGYDVIRCKTYLHSVNGAGCMGQGCAARAACPIGQGNRIAAQAAFHMKAFR